jgi:negative regulator of sigma E activity
MSQDLLRSAIDERATHQDWQLLLSSMEKDPSLKHEWDRWWLMRDAQQGVYVPQTLDVVGSIMARLDDAPEPALPLQPAASFIAQPAANQARWRWLAGALVLSAVSLVAGYGWGHGNQSSSLRGFQALPTQWVAAHGLPDVHPVPISAEQRQQMNQLLARHGVYGGPLSYARFTSGATAEQTSVYQDEPRNGSACDMKFGSC